MPNENINYLYDKRNIEATEKGLIVGGDESFPYVIDIAKERANSGVTVGDFSLLLQKGILSKGF